jgi:hypothetical protein
MRIAKANAILALALCTWSLAMPMRAVADEYPVVLGDWWEVSGIKLKDGGTLAYAKFLASQWRATQEFAKSKGWVKRYIVLQNPYPRHGEPDVYLITISDKLASGPESDKRNDEYMAWMKKSEEQLEKETGDRAEFREIFSSALLQEVNFR